MKLTPEKLESLPRHSNNTYIYYNFLSDMNDS